MSFAKHRVGELVLVGLLLLLIPLLLALANGIVLGGTEPDLSGAGTGICLEQPAEPSAITREQAIEAARAYLPPERKSAQVTAEYALYSDDKCNDHQIPGSFTKVPAWIVTFHDVKVPTSDTTFATKSHVAIHAQTGAIVREFAYR